jgi:hypothetical protein
MTHLSIIIYFNHNFLTLENNNKQEKSIRWKYSDMMRWMDEMHREVGLTIPPKKPDEQQPEKDTSIEVIFIKRRK